MGKEMIKRKSKIQEDWDNGLISVDQLDEMSLEELESLNSVEADDGGDDFF